MTRGNRTLSSVKPVVLRGSAHSRSQSGRQTASELELESPFLPMTRQRQLPVLQTKRRIYRFCLLLVSLSTVFLISTLVRGQENYPSFWAYMLVCGLILSGCLAALIALQNLQNVRRVEVFLTVASAAYLFYWDIVAVVSNYHPRAEFLMTSVAEFLLTAALFCVTLPRRRLLASLLGLFAAHDLLVWGNLLAFPWSPVHNAQLMSDFLTFVTMLTLSLIGTYQDMIAVSHREADVLEQLANTDTLTGLANRRQMYAQMQHLEHSGEGFGVLLLDVDDFKKVNDTYGHDAGDEVLVEVARILESVLQRAGKAGRWGGEEFVVVLPQATPESVQALAEEIRRAIEQQTRATRPVTLSIGGAVTLSGDTLDSTLRYADEAMYQAKRSGKNRVVFSQAHY